MKDLFSRIDLMLSRSVLPKGEGIDASGEWHSALSVEDASQYLSLGKCYEQTCDIQILLNEAIGWAWLNSLAPHSLSESGSTELADRIEKLNAALQGTKSIIGAHKEQMLQPLDESFPDHFREEIDSIMLELVDELNVQDALVEGYGALALITKNYARALEQSTKLLLEIPDFEPAHLVKVGALVGLGRKNEALDAINVMRGFELSPNAIEAALKLIC